MTTAPEAPDCTMSGRPPYQLSGCDLSGKSLAGKDLAQANLQNAKLLGTSFEGVVSLAGADLTGAVMGNGTDFSGCDLSATTFSPNANFGTNAANPTRFIGATVGYRALGGTWRCVDLTDAVIDLPADLTRLEVTQCNLTRFTAPNRTLRNAHFNGVVLRGADFSRARLGNVVFGQEQGVACDLTGAKFVGADITYGVLDTCTLTRTDFTGATLNNASFLQTRMDGTHFDKCDVTTCRFSTPPRFSTDRTNLTSFRGARLNYGTILKRWSFLDLTGATIVGLDGVRDLTYLQAQYAVLTGLNLANRTLDECNLTGATLTGVKFTGAQLRNALMYGVQNTCELFRVPATSPDYQPFSTALSGGIGAGVAAVFAKFGYSLAAAQTAVHTEKPNSWWTITDTAAKARYAVISATADGVTCLTAIDPSQVTWFDGATLTAANFSPDGARRTALRGAVFSRAVVDHADFNRADLGPANPDDPTTVTQFEGASMNDAGLSEAILTGAKLGSAYLHNADLVCANLKGADLTGAQLGALSELFRARPADYDPLLAGLRGDDPVRVAAVFKNYGYQLTAGQTVVETTVAERCWTVTDKGAQRSYTVLNTTTSDKTTVLRVSTPTQAATLSGAYLPNAKLVDANLYGVTATGAQLYGRVSMDGAILDGCDLNHANLAGASIVVKTLCKVNLSYANLINAKLTGADLSRGVTLSRANLQGADFTDTQMNGVRVDNAAVSVPLTITKADVDVRIAGTHLFSVSDGATYRAVVAELQASASLRVNLTPGWTPAEIEPYVAHLDRGEMSDVAPLFADQGVDFPSSARIDRAEYHPDPTDPGPWQIVSSAPPGNYAVWHGFTARGDEALLAAPSMPNLRRVFASSDVGGTLRWQATVVEAGRDPGRWQIDNDSKNPRNTQLGYATVLVRDDSDGSGGRALAFYGTTLRVKALGPDNTEVITIYSYPPTVLCRTDGGQCGSADSPGSASYFGPDTVCPNGRKLSDNQASTPVVSWERMLRALPPPAPPACVPSPYADCPQPTLAAVFGQTRRRRRPPSP